MADNAVGSKAGPEKGPERGVEADPAASEADAGKGGDGPPRIAIVWIPGLYASANTALDAIARRMAYALDRRASSAAARFAVAGEIEEVDRGAAGTVRRASIVRTDDSGSRAVADVFELNYAPTLLRPHQEATAFRRWLEATWVVLNGLVLALRTYRHGHAKTRLEKLQLVLGAFWLLLLVAYVWILLMAIIVAINSLFDLGLGTTLGLGGEAGWLSTIGGGLLVIVFGASATVPAIRERIERAGAATISAFAYLRVGRQRRALAGRLTDLVEHVAEAGPVYRRVDVVASSFGSLIALDALFPHGEPPEPRLATVNGLVTIGCPFDAVRAVWPAYAGNRQAHDAAPAGWLNIYAPLDVLGSNFRDDDKDEPAAIAVATAANGRSVLPLNRVFPTGQGRAGSVGWLDVILFGGFRAHRHYWGDQEEAGNSCFNTIVTDLFDGDPVLD